MEDYMPFLQQLASFGAYGYTIISVLYYLNQAAKNVGYIKSKWVLALTGGEAAYMVLTAYFAPVVFILSFAIMAMTAAVVQYHDAMKDKAGGGSPKPTYTLPAGNSSARTGGETETAPLGNP